MTWLRRILAVGAILCSTVLLVRGLYGTETGARIQRLVPDSVWGLMYSSFGLEGVETTSNAQIAVWLTVSLAFSITVICGGAQLLRRLTRRYLWSARTR
jgi:ABC-type multidrug transport system permease subunit